MIRRVAAVEATLARFRGRPFVWGQVDCVRVAVFHLRQMGHHPKLGLNRAGTYRSAMAAKRALTRAGHDSLSAALDSAFPRIAPAAAWPGDLVVGAGNAGWEAVGVIADHGTVIGFHDGAMDAGILVGRLDMAKLEGAWRL